MCWLTLWSLPVSYQSCKKLTWKITWKPKNTSENLDPAIALYQRYYSQSSFINQRPKTNVDNAQFPASYIQLLQITVFSSSYTLFSHFPFWSLQAWMSAVPVIYSLCLSEAYQIDISIQICMFVAITLDIGTLLVVEMYRCLLWNFETNTGWYFIINTITQNNVKYVVVLVS